MLLLLPLTSYYCQRIGCHITPGPHEKCGIGSAVAHCPLLHDVTTVTTCHDLCHALTSLCDAAEPHPRVCLLPRVSQMSVASLMSASHRVMVTMYVTPLTLAPDAASL